jgi:hypothetical protein
MTEREIDKAKSFGGIAASIAGAKGHEPAAVIAGGGLIAAGIGLATTTRKKRSPN